MNAADRGFRRDLLRWAICCAVVVALHGGLAAAIAYWPDNSAPAGGATAILIELAPVAEESAAEHANLPVGPLQEQQAEPQPEPLPQKEAEKPEPEPAPAKMAELPPPEPPPPLPAEVMLPPPPKPEPEQLPKKVAAVATAPERAERVAPRQRAVSQGAPSPSPNLIASYGAGVIRPHLLRFYSYPSGARAKGAQGVVLVRFSINRSGQLVARSISKSSGHSDLDSEALATLNRAQPYPPPPPGLTDQQFSFTLPMRYNIR